VAGDLAHERDDLVPAVPVRDVVREEGRAAQSAVAAWPAQVGGVLSWAVRDEFSMCDPSNVDATVKGAIR
jgi:hypothetical protein